MPEHEFELYLSLLSRFLKLNPQQREEIAEELRGHLEMRLEDLAKEGHTREEAIRIALDEMGDAGELAKHFSTIAKSRRRNLIMRFTVGMAVALAFGLVLFTAFWNEPERPQGSAELLAQRSELAEEELPAQEVTPTSEKFVLAEKTKVFESEELKLWEERLSREIQLDVEGLSLEEALQQVEDQGGFMIVVHHSVTDTADLGSIEMERNYGGLPLRNILNLILGPSELTYAPREGVLFIISREEAKSDPDQLQIRMYDCRDFLVATTPIKNRNDVRYSSELAQKMKHLMSLVMEYQGEWEITGAGAGSIQAMNGILIIKQTSSTHNAIERFLNEMRKPYLETNASSMNIEEINFGPEEMLRAEPTQEGQPASWGAQTQGNLF
ncbi:MAG: permease prefix domain 1-containing protein [Planctomycetaceae bacterium]